MVPVYRRQKNKNLGTQEAIKALGLFFYLVIMPNARLAQIGGGGINIYSFPQKIHCKKTLKTIQ